MTPSQHHTYFHQLVDRTVVGDHAEELTDLIRTYYTSEWFQRNDYVFTMSESQIANQPPLSLVQDCMYRKDTILVRYLGNLMLAHSHIGLTQQRFSRLVDPKMAFQTYFELRILTLLAISGFNVTCDVPTSRGRDVEAHINKDNFSSLIECKVLNLSESSIEFYRCQGGYKRYLVQQHLDQNASVCGQIECRTHFGEDTWQMVAGATVEAIKTGRGQTFETPNVKVTVFPNPTKMYPTLSISEVLPTSRRIKTTLDKTRKKLKGTKGAIIFCCVPREAGQPSAFKEIAHLLQNKKYNQLSQVFLVDPLDTFETEFTKFHEVINPHSSQQLLYWNASNLEFKIQS